MVLSCWLGLNHDRCVERGSIARDTCQVTSVTGNFVGEDVGYPFQLFLSCVESSVLQSPGPRIVRTERVDGADFSFCLFAEIFSQCVMV